MKPDKNISDEQLDALIRDVEVPENLHRLLLGIPDNHVESSTTCTTPPPNRNSSRLFAMVLAASLIAVAAFLSWQMLEKETDGTGLAAGDGITHGLTLDQVVKAFETPNSRLPGNLQPEQLASLDDSVELLEQEIHRMKMTAGLERLRRLQEMQAASALNELEVDSMIMALSGQASLPLGGRLENVEQKMARVIERFPGSRGAQIAQDFINKIEN